MMSRRRSAIFALLLVGACSGIEPTAPTRLNAVAATSLSERNDADTDRDGTPASPRSAATGQPVACQIPNTSHGSVLVGASGGELRVGPHRLIIPPGAVTTPTTISGTVPAGSSLQIHFEPSGLHFKVPAVLVLDVASCGPMPGMLYIDEQGGTLDRIRAFYNSWFHSVTGLVEHFSVYALDV